MASDAIRVAIVDDGSGVAEILRRRLRRHHHRYRVRCVQGPEDLSVESADGAGAVVVVVVSSDDHRGLEHVSQLRRHRHGDSGGPAIVVVHHGATPQLDAIVTGAQDVVGLGEASASRLDDILAGALIRKEAEDAARAEAFADPVTGLATRAWMTQRIERAVDHSMGDGWQVALLFCDLDRFKSVNDTLGHARGDQLLALVAERLRGVVRADDPIARIGGDEFVILLEGHRVDGLAHRIALRAVAALAEPFVVDGHVVSVTTSVGLALHRSGESAAQLLEHADLALYRAKRRGRNRIVAFDDELREWAGREGRQGSRLEADLAIGALGVERHTVVELPSRRPLGSICLPCWGHADSLAELLELAARRGLAAALGRWLIEQVVADLARDRTVRHTAVAVIPRGVATQPAFVDWVGSLIDASGVDPSQLTLALEEADLGDLEGIGEVLDRLDRLGVSIAVWNFGSGTASLTLLGSHRIDEVHLAAGITDGIGSDPLRRQLVEGLVMIAGAIGQRIIAGGVHTEADLRAVAAAGCHGAVIDLDLTAAPVIELDGGGLPFDITVAVG